MRKPLFLMVLSGSVVCTPNASDIAPLPVEENATPINTDDAHQVSSGPVSTTEEMERLGWAPVFRGPNGLETLRMGLLVGPDGFEEATSIGTEGACGGTILTNEQRAVLVIPGDIEPAPPPRAPGMSAARVERASWRMNEILPEDDSIVNPGEVPQPARQRGLEIGSVSKTRRHGAPPIYIVSGVRNCTVGVFLGDDQLHNVIDQYTWTGTCDPIAVLPAVDLDGDGAREFAVYNSGFVALLRLIETPGNVQMEPLAHWTCTPDGAPQ